MTRLNKSIKEKVIANAIEQAGVNRRQEALVERRAKLANDVRLFAIGGANVESEVNQTFDKIKKYLEKNSHKHISHDLYIAGRDNEIYVNFAGRAVNLYFNGETSRKGKQVFRNLVLSRHQDRVAIGAEHELNIEFDEICNEQKVINDLRIGVKSEVAAMVNSVTTVNKLIEIWPESKDLLPEDEKAQSTAVVADVNRLNIMIGLPKGESK